MASFEIFLTLKIWIWSIIFIVYQSAVLIVRALWPYFLSTIFISVSIVQIHKADCSIHCSNGVLKEMNKMTVCHDNPSSMMNVPPLQSTPECFHLPTAIFTKTNSNAGRKMFALLVTRQPSILFNPPW